MKKQKKIGSKFIYLFVISYLIFFTSRIWLDYEREDVKASKIGDVAGGNNVEFVLAMWEADSDKMQIVLEKEELSLEHKEVKYELYTLINKDPKKLDIDIKEKDDFIIITAKDISKKAKQFKLTMKTDSEYLKFLMDDENIGKLDDDSLDFNKLNKKVLEIRKISFNKRIKEHKKEIEENNKEIQRNLDKIKELDKDTEFLTDAELEKNKNRADSFKSRIASLNDNNKEITKSIDSLELKLKKIDAKIKSLK